MTKWKCINKECGGKCSLSSEKVPLNCVLDDECAEWEKVTEEPEQKQETELPKPLTAEVFDRPDCPEWARFAAVSMFGFLIFSEKKPKIAENECPKRWIIDGRWFTTGESAEFDDSSWESSIIERHVKLPNWCKCGALAYGEGRYGRITGICHTTGKIDIGETGHFIPVAECAEARLRPYNAEEMRGLTGKVLASKSYSHFSFLVVYAEDEFIKSCDFTYTAEELKDNFTINGKPCGVLEHLNNNGEWVA